eukprot:716177_1
MSNNELDDLEREIESFNETEWNEERFQRRMDHVSNASANIGSLLLKGWTMLADVCETCHSPLMQLPPASARCVVCNPLKEEQQKSNQITIIRSSKPAKKQSLNTSKKQSKLNDIDELKELNDKLWNNEKDSEFEKRMEKSQDASNKLGELLLKGWTMLSEHCNKCQTPLMSLRGGASMCCICDSNTQKQKININKVQKIQSVTQPIKHNNNNKNDNVSPVNEIKRNGFDEEQKRNEYYYRMRRRDDYGYYGPQPCDVFGFGYKEDEQLRHTMGNIVKTVLDKMNVINERMGKCDNSLQNDINELNNLMEFLVNV